MGQSPNPVDLCPICHHHLDINHNRHGCRKCGKDCEYDPSINRRIRAQLNKDRELADALRR